MARAEDIFHNEEDPDHKIKEVKKWLDSKGVRSFEPVSLFCDQLKKVCVSWYPIFRLSRFLSPYLKESVKQIEELADKYTASKSRDAIKKAIVKGIPRQAVLKPAHATYRLQNQHFELGDRVTMVQDSGGVPLSVKGVVIGMNAKSMDVVWDVPFMSGTTLNDRSEFTFTFALPNITNCCPTDAHNIAARP